ncbi:MAG: LemA family protein [Firmicutes bacterium]|nr:LemA family protein [Bacillota bacterium]
MQWILLGLVVLLVLYVMTVYNNLVRFRQRVRNAWSQIDVQLRRRYDLIPNLVNTVKGYMTHERETLEAITQARSRAMAAGGSLAEQAQAENALSGALRTLFAVAENYPQLKADGNFRQLQDELSNTESKIAFARQFYNDTVQRYNTYTEMFPSNLIARAMGFTPVDYFNLEGEPEARGPINVNFQ